MRRLILSFICACALLSGQQNALTHAAWHIRADMQTRQGHDDKGKTSGHGQFCGLHGLFAQVTGAAPGPSFHFALQQPGLFPTLDTSVSIVSVRVPIPRSRGPPNLS